LALRVIDDGEGRDCVVVVAVGGHCPDVIRARSGWRVRAGVGSGWAARCGEGCGDGGESGLPTRLTATLSAAVPEIVSVPVVAPALGVETIAVGATASGSVKRVKGVRLYLYDVSRAMAAA
jgi:hypothetical protein